MMNSFSGEKKVFRKIKKLTQFYGDGKMKRPSSAITAITIQKKCSKPSNQTCSRDSVTEWDSAQAKSEIYITGGCLLGRKAGFSRENSKDEHMSEKM